MARPTRANGDLVGGRYRVVGPLGRGGMGSVYRVVDETTGEPLALKELRPDTSSRESERMRLRFRREFHTMARLAHPHIVGVRDFGLDGTRPYYTMELLDGQDLRDLGPVPVDRACRLLRDVASALAFLHTRRLIHRDLAARNVRSTASGRAKLIDFGILATTGASADVAGTPPSVAPETLRGAALDHKVDLFGLGALGYWLLTGRHAFPANALGELEALWKRAPEPASRHAAGIPKALDDLLVSLLSIDPLGRPHSAAEVIDRLGAIAGLGTEHDETVARGYLVTTTLVGRQRELSALRSTLEQTIQGFGAAVVVEGPSGMGKSHLLREVALEAQLAGARVATAGRDATARGAYGVVRALLGATAPRLAGKEESGDEGARGGAMDAQGSGEERVRAQIEARGALLALAARGPLVLVIDDIQAADEASVAVLASLAHVARSHRLLIVAGRRTDEHEVAPAAVESFARAALRLRLDGLSPDETAELVRGLFGELSNAPLLADWIARVAQGSPLHSVEVARELVERGSMVYADGRWTLRDPPRKSELPQGMAAAVSERVASLAPAANALGELLAVHRRPLALEPLVRLSDAASEDDLFDALDELLEQGIVVGSAEAYRIAHDSLREALLARASETRTRELHLRVGHYLARHGVAPDQEADVGWHLLRGGERLRGAELLARAGRRLYDAFSFHDSLAPLEASIAAFEAEGVAPVRTLDLRHRLLMASSRVDRARMVTELPRLVADHRRYAGLDTARLLRPLVGRRTSLAVGFAEAWGRWALHRATKRPELPRPHVALRHFYTEVGIGAMTRAVGRQRSEARALLDELAPLDVFEDRAPKVASLMIRASLGMQLGRRADVARCRARVREILANSTLPRLDQRTQREIEALLVYQEATFAVESQEPGHAELLTRLEAFGEPFFDLCANVCRITYRRLRGEEELALRIEEAMEIQLVQLGSIWSPETQLAWHSSLAYGLTGDVVGLRRSIEMLERMNKAGLSLEPYVALARGEHAREIGDFEAAGDAIREALSAVEPGEAGVRGAALSALAETMLLAGDALGARRAAEEALSVGADPEVDDATLRFRATRVLALAEAHSGDDALRTTAAARLDRALLAARAYESPTLSGLLHEARARVALVSGARDVFEEHAREAEAWLRSTKNAALVRRALRLRELAAPGPASSRAADVETTTRPEALLRGPRRAPDDAPTASTAATDVLADDASTHTTKR